MTIPSVPFPQGIGSGGSPRCQEAMGDTIAQTRSERVSIPSYDSPLLRVNTLGSDGERIKLKELMEKCTKLFDRVLDLENVKDAQALEIKKLKKRVKKLENKKNSRTSQLKRRLFKVRIKSSAEKSLGDQRMHPNRRGMKLTKMKGFHGFKRMQRLRGGNMGSCKSLRNSESEGKDQIDMMLYGSNAALIEEWDTIKARIDVDAQLAKRLQAKEREQMHVKERARLLMEFITARKKFFAAKRTEEQRKKPPTKAEQRKKMYTYMKHMARYKDKNSKKKAVSKKRAGERPSEESVKKQKIEDDAEKAELKACLEIVPGDDIIRADGSTKYYKIFSAMLDDFDRQDVLDLYSTVEVTAASYEVTTAVYVSTAGVDYRKYSKMDHLLEGQAIPSVFSIWKAFEGNTRVLGSFREETDKNTDLHQHLSRISTQQLETASQITRDAVITHTKTASQDLKTTPECTTQPII
ncbi:putative ribonuclease H-like domain-containing protein [Tanacetum coccineum]